MTERSERTDQILRLSAASGARLAMRGAGMTPLFRDGMVLRVGPYTRAARVGDVVIFREIDKLIAHRVIAVTAAGVHTAGDAQPHIIEDVPHRDVFATVRAVYASDQPEAPRIDGVLFALRGQYYARCHRLRAALHRLGYLFSAASQFGFPSRRPRTQPALVAALSAIVRNDTAALAAAIASVDPVRFVQTATRHRCAGIVSDALLALDGDPAADRMRRMLVPATRLDAVTAIARRSQIGAIVRFLSEAHVPFALLKGAARVFRGEDGSAHHASCDIDILVPPGKADAAAVALQRHGYTFRASELAQARYRKSHHHLAALHPPKRNGAFVELHVALAPPGLVGLPTDWAALEPHLVFIENNENRARCFDAFATALHGAIHAIGHERLRDTFLCARALGALGPHELERLRTLASAEPIDPVRLNASLALAAQMAGIEWNVDARTAEYLRWAGRRDDMPRLLGARTVGVEAWFAAEGWNELAKRILTFDRPSPRQIAGRLALTPLALFYAARMQGP
jgi:hypothetical protein